MEASQEMANNLPNSTSVDFGRCILPVSALMPLIEKHKTISVRSSCLSMPDRTQHCSGYFFAPILAQPRVEQLHLSGRHPQQCRWHKTEVQDFLSTAHSVHCASITCLFIEGQYSTDSIQHWTPLLRGLPNLHTLTLHLEHDYSPDPLDKLEHWKVRQQVSWVQLMGADSGYCRAGWPHAA
jgi:hypothetical protein